MDEELLNKLSERVSALLEEQARSSGAKRPHGWRSRNLGHLGVIWDTYSQWRYENPGKSLIIRLGGSAFALALLTSTLWWVSGTGVGTVTGLEVVRSKITNVYYALLWSNRTNSESPSEISPERYPGTIEKVIDGVMIVSYYQAGTQHRRLVKPANVIVTNKDGFNEWAKQYLLKGMTFDFYIPLDEIKGHKVWAAVMWYRKTPVNVELVEKSLGYPEENPPTAVVNQVFSQHYWNLARGE